MTEGQSRRNRKASAKARKPKLLCVDDEPFILDGLRLNLRKSFEISTESDSVEAIKRINAGERFDVVISDMRMPKADGAEVLAAVRAAQPKTIRVLLTGHADIDAAMRAVNEGKIARYVTKPVEAGHLQEILLGLLEKSKQDNVTTDVLQKTVGGIVRTLADILAMLNPAAFGQAIRLRRPVRVLAEAMGLPDAWEFEIAALLSKLGCVALPKELLERKGRRLIAVGSGFETKRSRSKESSKLLTYGLTNFDLVKITEANKVISEVEVWLGQKNNVQVYSNQNIYKTIKKARKNRLKISVNYNGPIEAPIKKDQVIAKLKMVYDDELIGEYDLYAKEEVKRLNIFSRLIRSLNYLIWGDV